MIDHKYSREAFESLRTAAERTLRAKELAEELRAHLASARTPEDGLSSALARLRLVGHHLYQQPVDDDATEPGIFRWAGDPDGEEPPTGLELVLDHGTIQARYKRR